MSTHYFLLKQFFKKVTGNHKKSLPNWKAFFMTLIMPPNKSFHSSIMR